MKKYLCFLVLFCLFTLCSCGKMAAPEPVPDSGYPHIYPKE